MLKHFLDSFLSFTTIYWIKLLSYSIFFLFFYWFSDSSCFYSMVETFDIVFKWACILFYLLFFRLFKLLCLESELFLSLFKEWCLFEEFCYNFNVFNYFWGVKDKYLFLGYFLVDDWSSNILFYFLFEGFLNSLFG